MLSGRVAILIGVSYDLADDNLAKATIGGRERKIGCPRNVHIDLERLREYAVNGRDSREIGAVI